MQLTLTHAAEASVPRACSSDLLTAVYAHLMLTNLMTHHVKEVVLHSDCVGASAFNKNVDVSGAIRIAPDERGRLLFLVDELEARRALVHEIAERYSSASVLMEAAQATASPLDVLIAEWQLAHEKWRVRLDAGDNSDSPESKAEDFASEALLEYQCRSHSDVQRKVGLFLQNEHLRSLCGNYSDAFIQSLNLVEH